LRGLHIGGEIVKEGWEIFNIRPGKGVDYVRHTENHMRFGAEAFHQIYASHVLEHINCRMVIGALKEWYRVLKSDGKLYVSVPDMDVICGLFLDKNISMENRVHLLEIIYGGHSNQYDFHLFGYDLDILIGVLEAAGFKNATKTQRFGIFADSSDLVLYGRTISLNLIVRK